MWIALAILILLLLAVIALPLGVEVSSVAGHRKWTAILAGVHIPVPKSVIDYVDGKVKNRKKKSEKQQLSKQDLERGSRRLRSKESSLAHRLGLDNLRTILELVVRLLHTLHIRVHRLHILIASPDPAWTGVTYGMACAVIGALPRDWPISVEADWTMTVPESTYDVEVSVIPVQVIYVFAGTLWKRRRR